ncbi:hypothetical protein EYR41_008834 [Orbilia oligospora]|uniref:Uncharacterized protein n=1 Tax=Orbilia oligospora TaxID=2813651 RepID=A0A7C8P893_ORBOL|nr:hypothetical protein TWF751_010290 [Orbilia oligospora]TGJ67267.1 hypothetical protein EYR41_008834 [Orbilia oligospora]
MCKLRVTQFTCGHSHEGIEEICGWMKLRPHRAKLQCPYRDPKGTLFKDTSKCRECYFAESEAPAQFRDPNITKRVSPKASKALADPVSVGGSARPWSMSKEERRQRIAERYGVYSDRDLPVSDPAYKTIFQTLASVNGGRPSRRNDSRPGNSNEYSGSCAYERHGTKAVPNYTTNSNAPCARSHNDRETKYYGMANLE